MSHQSNQPDDAAPQDAGEKTDEYGNPLDGSLLLYCCFPDCGCDGARLCAAQSGANFSALNLNIERGSL